MLFTVLAFSFVALFFLLLFLLSARKPNKENLIPVGGKRLKEYAALLMIKAGSKKERPGKPKVLTTPKEIDRRIPQEGVKLAQYNDSLVFYGYNDSSSFLSRLGFRGDGTVEVTCAFTLDKGARVLKSPIEKVKWESDSLMSAGGLSYTCIESGKHWRIDFQGDLVDTKTHDVCSGEAHFEWRANAAMYNSGVHMDARSTARAMSEMEWSKDYFDKLSSESAQRIEQGGILNGRLEVTGIDRSFQMLSIRDHSWGKRDWGFLNRYIWNIFSLKSTPLLLNGKTYTHFCYTTVDYGSVFKRLVTGWIAGPEHVLPIVEATDHEVITSSRTVPPTFQCKFRPQGGPLITMTINRATQEVYTWHVNNDNFEIADGRGEAVLQVDGLSYEALGVSEFGFNINKYHE